MGFCRVKDVAIAKMLWSGTNNGNDGVLGEGWKAERRRVAYRGLIWLERREFDLPSHTPRPSSSSQLTLLTVFDVSMCSGNDSEELSSVEAWGDLPKFRAQLEGKEEVTEAEWTEARTMKVDTTKGELPCLPSPLTEERRAGDGRELRFRPSSAGELDSPFLKPFPLLLLLLHADLTCFSTLS